MSAPGPLQGVRVVEIGGWIAGPLTGRLLADLGASVEVVAPPTPPGLSPVLRRSLSADKRVFVVDLRSEEGRAIADELIARADVVIENARPGALLRLGVDAKRWRAERPELVWVSLPGFSAEDPELADLPAWDGVIGALYGLFTDVSPTRAPLGLATYTALPLASVYGAASAAVGIVAALLARERTGQGETIEAPLAAALATAMSSVLMLVEGQPARYDVPPLPAPVARALPLVRRVLARLPEAAGEAAARAARAAVPPLMDSYGCADGRDLYVFAIDHDRLPIRLLEIVGVLDALHDHGLGEHDSYGPARSDNLLDATMLSPAAKARVRKALRTALAARPAREWELALTRAGVPCAVQATTQQWMGDPATRAAGLIVDRDGVEAPGPSVWLHEPRAVPGGRLAPLSVGQRPLTGVRVLDLSSMVAGPVAARILGELGADVLKLDPTRPHHGPRLVSWLGLDVNRGKASALIDLAASGGADTARAILASSDVVIDNMLPGVLARHGLDPGTLRKGQPELCWTTISAFGGPTPGPADARPGYDPVLQAATGVMLRYGAGRPELHAIASCVDALTGHLAALGALACLYSRETGRGTAHAHTSLACAAQLAQLPFMLAGHVETHAPEQGPPRGSGPLQRLYRARDGWLYLGAAPSQAPALLETLGARAHDTPDDALLTEALAAAIAEHRVSVAVARLRSAGAGAAAVTSAAAARRAASTAGPRTTVRARRNAGHPAATAVTTVIPTSLRFERFALADRDAVRPGADTRSTLELALGKPVGDALIASGTALTELTPEYLPA